MNDPRMGTGASHGAGAAPTHHPGPHAVPQRPATVPPRAPAPVKPSDEPIELVDELEAAPIAAGANGTTAPAKPRTHTFAAQDMTRKEETFQRQLHSTPTGATRVKSFHGRLSDQGLEYMDHTINEWLDRHPDVDVKFVTSVTGVYEGKIREPAVILNVWY